MRRLIETRRTANYTEFERPWVAASLRVATLQIIHHFTVDRWLSEQSIFSRKRFTGGWQSDAAPLVEAVDVLSPEPVFYASLA